MPFYSYKATDLHGKVVQGNLEASSEGEVVKNIRDMGCIPIRISTDRQVHGRLKAILNVKNLNVFQGVASRDVLLFTQDLASLLAAGLPVDRSLTILIDVAEKERFQAIIREILKSVQGGGYLSDAIKQHPRVFPAFYVNMVRAGEAGGVLESVLQRLALFLESAQELKDYIKSALIYPLFLVAVGGISIIILLTFVIPKFAVIFADLGHAIPLSTRMLLEFSDFIRSYWWLIAVIVAAGIAWYRKFSLTKEGRYKIDQVKLRFPVLAGYLKNVEMARLARTLGTLIRSGVPILQALELVKDIIGNRVIAEAMNSIQDRVKEGDRLSQPMLEMDLFPPLAIQMITVGEETGKLDEMLLNVGRSYEKSVRNTLKRFIGFIEPAMILIMGLVVGFIVISMLMAVFSMNEIPF
jgi:general secretion pathway protein F